MVEEISNDEQVTKDSDKNLQSYSTFSTRSGMEISKTVPPPPRIEGYDIIEYLGRGSMGTVWKARQKSVNREVALKLLAPERIGSPKSKARFEQEVELAARLKHENIARIYDSGVQKGVYFYVMELIDGVHLDEYVKQQKLSDLQILSLMATICKGVEHAHQHGVIHRDLKPSNILVTQEGKPYVVDFGLAKTQEITSDSVVTGELPEKLSEPAIGKSNIALTQEGAVTGTLAYMSPEQAAGGSKQITIRSDIYNLGVILYYLLLGEYPHDLNGGFHQVRRRVATEEIRPPCQFRPNMDKKLQDLLLMALKRDPDQRYPYVGDLAKDLRNYPDGPLLCHPLERGERIIDLFRKYYLPIAVGTTLVTVLTLITLFAITNVLHINTFSLYDLIAFVFVAPLAVFFFISYLTMGKRLIELLFACFAIIMAIICLMIFLEDNAVPFGELARKFPQAAEDCLLYKRIMYVVGIFGLAIQLHFIFRYCDIRHWLSKRIYLFYIVFTICLPVVFTDAMLVKRVEPIAERSSWSCVVPWMSEWGSVCGLYLLIWLIVQVFTQIVLIKRRFSESLMAKGPLSQINMIRWAFVIMAFSVIFDGILGYLGFFGIATIASFPLGVMIWGVLISLALVKERLPTEP